MGLQRDSTTSISQILYCKLWLKYSYSKSSLCHDKRISLGKIEEIKRKTPCEKKPLNLHKFSDKNTNHVGALFKYFSTFYLLSVLSFPYFSSYLAAKRWSNLIEEKWEESKLFLIEKRDSTHKRKVKKVGIFASSVCSAVSHIPF